MRGEERGLWTLWFVPIGAAWFFLFGMNVGVGWTLSLATFPPFVMFSIVLFVLTLAWLFRITYLSGKKNA